MILDLQKAAKEGDQNAIEAIVSQHRSQIRAMAWRLDCGRMLFDDLQSEGLIGILQAIDYNDPSKNMDLKPLVGRFARFRMWNFLKKDQNYKLRIKFLADMPSATRTDESTGEKYDVELQPIESTPATKAQAREEAQALLVAMIDNCGWKKWNRRRELRQLLRKAQTVS